MSCQRRSVNHNSWHRGSHRLATAICAANAAPWERASSRWTPYVSLRRIARSEKKTGGSHRQSIGRCLWSWPLSWPLSRCYARGSGIGGGVREDAVAVARRRTGNVDRNAQNKQTMSKKNGDQKQCGIAGIVVYRSSQRVVLSETRDASLVEGKEWKPPPSQNTRRDSDWPPGRRVCLLSRTRLEMRLERCIALGGVAGGALQVSNAQFNVDISISTTVNISAASTSVTVISRIPASRHGVPLHLESLELRYVTMEILPNSRPFQCNNLGNAALQPHQRESRVRVVISVTTSMSTMRHPETDSSSS